MQRFKKITFLILRKLASVFSGTKITQIFFLRRFYNYLLRFFHPKEEEEKTILIEFQRQKMYVDPIDTWIYQPLLKTGILEREVTKLFIENVKRGMTIIDIGANIGYYTLIAAKLIGKKGRVYAFEPELSNFNLLIKNIKLNNYKNVIAIQKAVSDRDEKTRLFLSESNREGHRIYNLKEGRRFIEIETTTLDNFFKNREGEIDVIKMDIEGAEIAALKGMNNILKANQKLKLFIEFVPFILSKGSFNPIDLPKEILRHGFKIYIINEKFKNPIFNAQVITQIALKEKTINLFCTK
jgi:FkbM family methyltransferase